MPCLERTRRRSSRRACGWDTSLDTDLPTPTGSRTPDHHSCEHRDVVFCDGGNNQTHTPTAPLLKRDARIPSRHLNSECGLYSVDGTCHHIPPATSEVRPEPRTVQASPSSRPKKWSSFLAKYNGMEASQGRSLTKRNAIVGEASQKAAILQ